jgi:hypothetical protein
MYAALKKYCLSVGKKDENGFRGTYMGYKKELYSKH